jgi:NodT family efflux transporter outer membrane factor (OMF) lipoprotein
MIPATRQGAVAVALILALGGCEVGPDFQNPAAPAVSGYTRDGLPAATTATGVPGGTAQNFVTGLDIPGQWWELFHSRPLDALVAQALQNNPDIASARAALRVARENAYAGQGALFPSLTANGQAERERVSGVSLGRPGTSSLLSLVTGALNISYTLDVFGANRRQVEQLAAQAEYQRDELEATYLTLTSNVVTAAVQEASLRGQIAATEDIIKLETDQLGVVQRQFELGGIAKSDVLTQQSTLAATQATLPPLQKALAQNRDKLTALAGRFPSQEIDQIFSLDQLALPRELPVSLPSSLVAQRPDVRAAAATLHAASAAIGVATANELPQFTISGQIGTTAGSFGDLFSPGTAVWSIVGSAAQTLFDGGTLLHRKRAAVATFQQDAAQYQSTVITAFQNVADALRAVQYDADTLKAQAAAERTALESLNLSREQFQAGAITYLTLIDAQRSYQQARINLVQAQASRYSDTAALFQALGGGWWHRGDVTPDTQGAPDRTWLLPAGAPAPVAPATLMTPVAPATLTTPVAPATLTTPVAPATLTTPVAPATLTTSAAPATQTRPATR